MGANIRKKYYKGECRMENVEWRIMITFFNAECKMENG
jgi:hypothetical protein